MPYLPSSVSRYRAYRHCTRGLDRIRLVLPFPLSSIYTPRLPSIRMECRSTGVYSSVCLYHFHQIDEADVSGVFV
jgi:hypothetical protein